MTVLLYVDFTGDVHRVKKCRTPTYHTRSGASEAILLFGLWSHQPGCSSCPMLHWLCDLGYVPLCASVSVFAEWNENSTYLTEMQGVLNTRVH